MEAVKMNKLDIYKKLVNKEGIDFNAQNKKGSTILHIVTVGKKNKKLKKEILNNEKIDVNIQNNDLRTALHVAIDNNKKFMAVSLINNPKSNLNIKDKFGYTPFSFTLEKLPFHRSSYLIDEKNISKIEKISYLLLKNPNVKLNENDNPYCLHIACKKRSLQIVSELILRGYNINSKNKDGIFNFQLCK